MRLLLIARHYPPAVSGGARRPFFLANALRDLGAEVFVVAPSLPDGEPGVAVPHPNRDPSPSPNAAGLSPRDVLREYLLWPDPDIRWSSRAAKVAAANAPWRPDWIWTTSPPESIHAAGLRLKRTFGARWVADFRDHWLTRPHRLQRHAAWRSFGERHIARRWLPRADLVTAVDSEISAELSKLGARNPNIIPHAATPPTRTQALPEETINVVHTGSLSLSDPECDIALLLHPFEAALRTNRKLRLHLAGRLTERERAALAASAAASAITDHGVVPLDQARALQAGADALIFAASPKMHVPPSKISEYLTTDAPIIACGDGPWRRDERSPQAEPEAALVALVKGARAEANRPRPSTPAIAAAQFLGLMREAMTP